MLTSFKKVSQAMCTVYTSMHTGTMQHFSSDLTADRHPNKHNNTAIYREIKNMVY